MSITVGFVAAVAMAEALVVLPCGADAATAGASCSTPGRTQISSTASEGLLLCSAGAWASAGAPPLTAMQINAINALLTRKTAGSACTTGESIALDASNNLLACNGATWQLAGGGAAGTSPTPFAFADVAGAAFAVPVCSSAVTLGGLQTPAYASVSRTGTGSPYVKVNGAGAAGQSYATVVAGDALQVCATSANANLAGVQVPVTVGGFTTTWTLTTGSKIPDPFAFGAPSPVTLTDVATQVSACTGPLSGFTLPSPLTVSTTRGTVSGVNIGGTGWVAYTGSHSVSNGQAVCVRLTTDASGNTVHTVTATLGAGVSGGTPVSSSYTAINPNVDYTPDGFTLSSWTYNGADGWWYSNIGTVSGVIGNVPVSIDNGYQFSIAGGPWNSAASTITNGQTIQARVNGSALGHLAVGTLTVTLQQGPGSQIWYSSGSWRAPPGVTAGTALAVAGGGSGGPAPQGSGGGSGHVAVAAVSVTPNQVYPVTVGRGGVRVGDGCNCQYGDNGTESSFGTLLSAAGGYTGGRSDMWANWFGRGGSGGGGGGLPGLGNGGSGGAGGQSGQAGAATPGGVGDGFDSLAAFGGLFTVGAGGAALGYGGGGGGGVLVSGAGPASPAEGGTSRGYGGAGFGAGGGGIGTTSNAGGGAGASGFVYFQW